MREFFKALAVKVVLDRLAGSAAPAPVKGTRRRRRATPAKAAAREPLAPVRRGPLFALMMASAGIAVPLMVIFEAPVTRVIGVIGLFAFIISGVFVIADPAFLGMEDDEG